MAKAPKQSSSGSLKSDDSTNGSVTEVTIARHPLAHPKGGMSLFDEGGVIPAATKEILAKVANKLIKVQFSDILKMSAPALIHSPVTYLECAAMDMRNSARYLTKAAETKDPIHRLKLITCMYLGG